MTADGGQKGHSRTFTKGSPTLRRYEQHGILVHVNATTIFDHAYPCCKRGGPCCQSSTRCCSVSTVPKCKHSNDLRQCRVEPRLPLHTHPRAASPADGVTSSERARSTSVTNWSAIFQ